MKKICATLSIILLTITSVIAQGSSSFLKIRLTDNMPISVAIDRRFYNEENSVITIRNFPSGRHYLRVFRWSEREQRNITVYEGEIFLQPAVFSSMVIDRRTGLARVNNRRMNRDYSSGYVYDWENNNHYRERDDWGEHNNNTINDNSYYNNQNSMGYNPQGNYNGNNNSFGNNNINSGNNFSNNSYQGSRFSQQDMSDLHSRVINRITDTDKLKLLQSVLGNRVISTEQAIQIVDWLSFESTKLEFAKWVYGNIIDRNNFWKIDSEFTFENTKTEFNNFLNDKR
jgi:hypothetical protein